MAAGGLAVRLRGYRPGARIGGGAGARDRAGLRLAPQPLVREAGGRRQRRGPGPLGPGADLRRRRQLGQGWQRAGGRAAYRYPFVAAGAARRARFRDVAGAAAAAFPAGDRDAAAT